MSGPLYLPKGGVLSVADKDRPSLEWISALRRRYVTEPEIDRLLTRKMERRAGHVYKPVSLEQLSNCLESLLRAEIGNEFEISDARWLSGGASKLQMAFTLGWDRPGIGYERTPMVLRMEPAESLVETSRLREFQLIKAVAGVVPVPPVFWCDEDGKHLPYPGLIYGFAAGVAKPSNTTSGVSGVGTQLAPEIRKLLAPQFVEHLASIHSLDVHKADLSAFQIPVAGTQCAQLGLDWWERVWEEDGDEEIPLLRMAAGWLRRTMPVLDQPVIVHADYRLGNFLFTEPDMRISALLDWELGRIGDRHQDLAWTTSRTQGSFDTETNTFLVSSMMSEPEFLEAYEKAANFSVNQRTMRWYQVYNNFSLAVLLLGTGYRIARNRKTHQDVLVAWLMGIGYVVLDQLGEQLERGL